MPDFYYTAITNQVVKEDKSSFSATESRLRDEGGKEREENKFSSCPFAMTREREALFDFAAARVAEIDFVISLGKIEI